MAFQVLEIPNLVFADMAVRSARAERSAAQALAAAAEARAVAAETRAELAEMWRWQAEAAEARAKAAEAHAEADEGRAEAAEGCVGATHARSDRLMAALIEALKDAEGGVDVEALQRLLEE